MGTMNDDAAARSAASTKRTTSEYGVLVCELSQADESLLADALDALTSRVHANAAATWVLDNMPHFQPLADQHAPSEDATEKLIVIEGRWYAVNVGEDFVEVYDQTERYQRTDDAAPSASMPSVRDALRVAHDALSNALTAPETRLLAEHRDGMLEALMLVRALPCAQPLPPVCIVALLEGDPDGECRTCGLGGQCSLAEARESLCMSVQPSDLEAFRVAFEDALAALMEAARVRAPKSNFGFGLATIGEQVAIARIKDALADIGEQQVLNGGAHASGRTLSKGGAQ